MVIDLHRAGAPAPALGRVMATVSDALTRRLIELAEVELGSAARSLHVVCAGQLCPP